MLRQSGTLQVSWEKTCNLPRFRLYPRSLAVGQAPLARKRLPPSKIFLPGAYRATLPHDSDATAELLMGSGVARTRVMWQVGGSLANDSGSTWLDWACGAVGDLPNASGLSTYPIRFNGRLDEGRMGGAGGGAGVRNRFQLAKSVPDPEPLTPSLATVHFARIMAVAMDECQVT
jgi:hypothetical protein